MKQTEQSAKAMAILTESEELTRTLVISKNGEKATIVLKLTTDTFVSDYFWAEIQDKFMDLHARAENIFSD